MIRFKKSAFVLAPLLSLSMVFACTPTQVNTAKSVMSNVGLYSSMARALIAVAKANYNNNPKVKPALEAAEEALRTVSELAATIGAGLSSDWGGLQTRLVTLLSSIFVLAKAISDAKNAKNQVPSNVRVVSR